MLRGERIQQLEEYRSRQIQILLRTDTTDEQKDKAAEEVAWAETKILELKTMKGTK